MKALTFHYPDEGKEVASVKVANPFKEIGLGGMMRMEIRTDIYYDERGEQASKSGGDRDGGGCGPLPDTIGIVKNY